jgi:adenosine deaminase
MALTICPLSNLRLKGVRDLRSHPLKRMLDKGLFVTVNSDDPAYFGGYVGENYSAIQEALSLTDPEMRAIARNGFAASFMADEEKKKALAAFDRAAA